MNRLTLNHEALSVFVAAISLAGCGGVQSSAGAPGPNTVAPGSRTVPTSGSAFSGSYFGMVATSGCGQSAGPFFFRGSGKSSFLGPSYESGILQANRVCAWRGGATLQSSKYPHKEIFMALSEGRGNIANPCDITFTYVAHGGTGKFTHAKGSGTLTFQCSGSAYSDQWSGTLSF